MSDVLPAGTCGGGGERKVITTLNRVKLADFQSSTKSKALGEELTLTQRDILTRFL